MVGITRSKVIDFCLFLVLECSTSTSNFRWCFFVGECDGTCLECIEFPMFTLWAFNKNLTGGYVFGVQTSLFLTAILFCVFAQQQMQLNSFFWKLHHLLLHFHMVSNSLAFTLFCKASWFWMLEQGVAFSVCILAANHQLLIGLLWISSNIIIFGSCSATCHPIISSRYSIHLYSVETRRGAANAFQYLMLQPPVLDLFDGLMAKNAVSFISPCLLTPNLMGIRSNLP